MGILSFLFGDTPINGMKPKPRKKHNGAIQRSVIEISDGTKPIQQKHTMSVNGEEEDIELVDCDKSFIRDINDIPLSEVIELRSKAAEMIQSGYLNQRDT